MKEQVLLNENERLDDLQNGFFLIQDPSKFCFGIDAVLLAAFADVKPGERVIDLGTGNGIIPVLLAARSKSQTIEGLEIQAAQADLAVRSVNLNHLQNRIHITKGDIKEAAVIYGTASFHVVTCNPPYMLCGHGRENADLSKAVARHEVLCTLADIARQSCAILKDGGRLYMIHRPFRLVEIFAELTKNRLEPKKIRMIHPYQDKKPSMVLIEARKGGSAGLEVLPPLVVYEKPGVYTQEVLEIYRYDAGA